MTALPEPTRRLPEAARSYWRVTAALGSGPLLVGAVIVRAVLDEAGAGALVASLPVVAVLAGAVFGLTLLPGLRWRRWAYEIRDDEIDLRHGALVVRRTLVPIRRVQHVDTSAGPVQASFGLATVTFHTAAGTTSIPALSQHDAEVVRGRVAELARTRDDT